MRVTGLRIPRKMLLNDLVTGLVMAVINVPQALASGVPAGLATG